MKISSLVALSAATWINQVLFIFGLRLATATNCAILETTTPITALLIAAMFGLENLGQGRVLWTRLTAVACSVTGAICAVLASYRVQGDLASSRGENLTGNLLLAFSTLCVGSLLACKQVYCSSGVCT